MVRPTAAAAASLCVLFTGGLLLTAGCAMGGRTGAGDGHVPGGDGSQADAAMGVDVGPLPDGYVPDAQVIPDAQPGVDAATCTGGCNTPPGDCYMPTGQCVGTTCVYSYKAFGDNCNDGDGCTTNDTCDGQGNCFGDQLNCNPPHTSGGSCSNGSCVGIQCVSGWGDCDWDLEGTGCETPLNTNSNCSGCGITCGPFNHASASCASGSCQMTCTSPWDDCNNSQSDGCEIPTGVVNQCSASGLDSTNGCWTAWCGQSSDTYAYNQSGNWYCARCANCEEVGSQCHWCSHDTGTWFPLQTCGCTNYPVVCGPY